MGADLEQVYETDASECHDEMLNAKEVISSKLVKIHKKRRWRRKIYWRRSGSENSNLTRNHPRCRRSATWPSWRIGLVSTNSKA